MEWGVTSALAYRSAHAPQGADRLIFGALLLAAAQGVLAIGAGWWLAHVLLSAWQPAALFATQVYLLSAPSSLLLSYLAAIAQGRRRYMTFASLRWLATASYTTGIALCWWRGFESPATVLMVVLALQSAATLIAIIVMILQCGLTPAGAFVEVRALCAFGLRSYGGNLAGLANSRLDQYVLSLMVTLAELGQYAVAVSFASALIPLAAGFAITLLPRVAGVEAAIGCAEIRQTVWRNLRISLPAALIAMGAAPWFLPWIFGDAFQAASRLSQLLIPAAGLIGMNYIMSEGLRGLGRPAAASRAEALGLVATVFGLIASVPRYGAWGAAWTSLASYTVTGLWLWRAVARGSDAPYSSADTAVAESSARKN
jgi:O-antigen/teichoic acid export membrane protein